MNRLLTSAGVVAAVLMGSSAPGAASASATAATYRVAHHARIHRATASKRSGAGSRDPVATAGAVARRFWGATPCAGQIKIVANRPLVPGLAAGTDGWVTFNSALGANNLNAPASSYTKCTISLAHWQWGTRADMERDWGMFCLTITHEMGHLLGYQHTLRTGSVMNPVFTNDAAVPPACHAAWLPGWRTPGER